jgi:mannose-6-phosphate isomerase-like protein (cupin superfamily)
MIKNTTTGEHYDWGGVCEGWRLLERPDLSVIEERIPPGAGETRHVHGKARQVFFVLRGELRIELGDRVFELAAEDSLEIPPGEPHSVRNAGSGDVMFLVISAPTTKGDRTNLEP